MWPKLRRRRRIERRIHFRTARPVICTARCLVGYDPHWFFQRAEIFYGELKDLLGMFGLVVESQTYARGGVPAQEEELGRVAKMLYKFDMNKGIFQNYKFGPGNAAPFRTFADCSLMFPGGDYFSVNISIKNWLVEADPGGHRFEAEFIMGTFRRAFESELASLLTKEFGPAVIDFA